MNKASIAALAALSCLEIILQLVATLLGLPAAIIGGALLAVLSYLVFHFMEIKLGGWWPLLAQASGASLGGVLLAWLTLPFRPALALAPVAACGSMALLTAIERWRAEQCALCKRPLLGELSFVCPRCDLRVCERQCWNFMGCRCRLCDEHRVPVLTGDSRWWDRNFGARSVYGKCQLCQQGAAEADLRLCGHCGRPHCRDCWDFANGTCSRCQWMAGDLPERLKAYLHDALASGTRH